MSLSHGLPLAGGSVIAFSYMPLVLAPSNFFASTACPFVFVMSGGFLTSSSGSGFSGGKSAVSFVFRGGYMSSTGSFGVSSLVGSPFACVLGYSSVGRGLGCGTVTFFVWSVMLGVPLFAFSGAVRIPFSGLFVTFDVSSLGISGVWS